MKIYDKLNGSQIDILKEIGSIGTGNAATALSSLLNEKIIMRTPDVNIMEYNQAIDKIGGPEKILVGILVEISGDLNGVMLYTLEIEFANAIIKKLLNQTIDRYDTIDNMKKSVLLEIGNIVISSYINAISTLANININVSVPAICVNMAGAILTVPMLEYGYQTDKLMTIGGEFLFSGQTVSSNLMLVPEINSLDDLLRRIGVFIE